MTFYLGHSRFLRIYDDERRLQEIVCAVNYYLSAGESRRHAAEGDGTIAR